MQSSSSKVIGFVVLVVLVLIGVVVTKRKSDTPVATSTATTTTNPSDMGAAALGANATTTPVVPVVDSSDTSISQDTIALDAQFKAFDQASKVSAQ